MCEDEWTPSRTLRVVVIGLYHVMTSYVPDRFRSLPRTAELVSHGRGPKTWALSKPLHLRFELASLTEIETIFKDWDRYTIPTFVKEVPIAWLIIEVLI